MIVEFFSTLGPWAWWVLGLILLAIEVALPGFFFLWFGNAALINIAWDAAGSKFSGIGMRQGKWLIVGWSLPDGGPYGVVDYQLKGSVAAGRWSMVGQESLETENLKRADAP